MTDFCSFHFCAGGKLRATAATGVHDQSSRSHAWLANDDASNWPFSWACSQLLILSVANRSVSKTQSLASPLVFGQKCLREKCKQVLESLTITTSPNHITSCSHIPQQSPRLCRIFIATGDMEGCVTLVDLAGSEHRIVPW